VTTIMSDKKKGASDHLSGGRTPWSLRPHEVREDQNMRQCPRCEGRKKMCHLCDGTGEVTDTRHKILMMQAGLEDGPMIG